MDKCVCMQVPVKHQEFIQLSNSISFIQLERFLVLYQILHFILKVDVDILSYEKIFFRHNTRIMHLDKE